MVHIASGHPSAQVAAPLRSSAKRGSEQIQLPAPTSPRGSIGNTSVSTPMKPPVPTKD